MNLQGFVHQAEHFAEACRELRLPDDLALLEELLHASEIVRYEVTGLADRIRVAMVNNTPRPGPVKPLNPPPKSPPPKDGK